MILLAPIPTTVIDPEPVEGDGTKSSLKCDIDFIKLSFPKLILNL